MAMDMEWGSCQYDVVAEMFHKLCELEEKVGREEVLEQLGWEGIKPVTDYIQLLQDTKQEIEDAADDEIIDDDQSAILIVALGSNPTGDEVMKCLRSMGWDLWSAAPFVAMAVWPELPRLKLAGAYCWLLHTFDIVKNEESFSGFDT
jgi:hypothetical protein